MAIVREMCRSSFWGNSLAWSSQVLFIYFLKEQTRWWDVDDLWIPRRWRMERSVYSATSSRKPPWLIGWNEMSILCAFIPSHSWLTPAAARTPQYCTIESVGQLSADGGGCPVRWEMFSSTHFCPLDASSTPLNYKKKTKMFIDTA